MSIEAWKPLALALVVWLVLQVPLSAAVITVSTGSGCTLVDAITAANTDTATGSCPKGDGADHIVLTEDVTLTAVDNTTDGNNGLPSIASEITIQGEGHEVSRSSALNFRIFHVGATGELALLETTISEGAAENVEGISRGGGLYNRGVATLTNTTVSMSQVSGDNATGGGLHNLGTATLKNVTISQNTVTGVAARGGGIYNVGTTTLINTTLSGNTAVGAVAGVGGGLDNTGMATLKNVTVYGSTGHGVSGNSSLNLENTIVAGSTLSDCSGVILDDGGNFHGDGSCGAGFTSITPGVDFSTTLEDNGGPVMTHALEDSSDAIDQDSTCELLIDGREALRDGNCDSGAYEYGADDQYELSGVTGVDDACYGHHIPFGKAERHLHRQDAEDWIWFEAEGGTTYEIRTSNLLGGTDTKLELFEKCVSLAISDTDGGGGSTSLITYTPVADATLDVKISDEVGSGPEFGYDVNVTCTANCPTCSLAGGDSYELANETLFSYSRLEACTEVLTTGVTTVKAGAKAILRAGSRVEFENGFNVEENGAFSVEIDPNLVPVP